MRGVYVLVLELDRGKEIQIGRLGKIHFRKGFYAYTGSARGRGGFRRVFRHFNVASGINRTRKWHIDYLLPYSEVVYAVLMPSDEDNECNLAENLSAFMAGIQGFGCSDCCCPAHLFFSETEPKNMVLNTCNKLIGNESIIIRPNM